MKIARWMFVFFLVSGFCSLAYEVVWLRLAMASFGVTTPLVSIVLSVFMGGLALGSWVGGRLVRALDDSRSASALRLYALAELCIGVSGLVVPYELRFGRQLLSRLGEDVAWASGAHYLAAGAWITLALLPFCTAMGATFPLGMAALRRAAPASSERSFSYLYLANVLGATLGTLASAFVLIEWLGFRGTGLFAAALNGLLAGCALLLGLSASPRKTQPQPQQVQRVAGDAFAWRGPRGVPWLLFTTGLLSMAMEVVWVRQFTPFLGTVVYSFASILAVYLGATFLGSMAYRKWARSRSAADDTRVPTQMWILTFLFALLPLLLADPRPSPTRATLLGLARMTLGIAPFCAAVGFLTPMLVDRWSRGDPRRAGSVYAVNIVGCILGPLLACFVSLPRLGERWSLVAMSLPLAAISLTLALRPRSMPSRSWPLAIHPLAALGCASFFALLLIFLTRDFETIYPRREVRRDYTATVIATGEGMQRNLLINGEGITILTPITKMMAHLPLAYLPGPPRQVLVICFGMGTSFRSSVSWGAPTTVVDLIPSVPVLFGYFHADAASVLAAPGARVVVDDGRRFLERSSEKFDVVTIDPPPPIQAAGSSLLYSREFYEVIKDHLAPGGIVQQWFPGGELSILASVTQAVRESFPYVRVFRSLEGWGYHYLASMEPIPLHDPATLAGRLPAAAAADMVEWFPNVSPVQCFERILSQELPLHAVANVVPGTPPIEDDRPFNEYYFLRWLSGRTQGEYATQQSGSSRGPG